MPVHNTALAFLLVCAAGLSTCIGAAVVYHPTYVKLANKQTLGAALGISAGVMLYVSFVEIFSKSLDAFSDYGLPESKAYLFTTLCFFTGFIAMNGLNKIVHMLDPDEIGHDYDFDIAENVAEEAGSVRAVDVEMMSSTSMDIEALGEKIQKLGSAQLGEDDRSVVSTLSEGLEEKKRVLDEKLHRMGLVTALAIGLHNFPEGLATFVATLADPAVGVALAIAIAIHNIPEGICVAIPIYFASGNKHKAFLWASVSGMSEIVAAGLGWIALAHMVGDLVYAVLFGGVAGMMVNICIYQLLPTAHNYDPTDKYVSNAVLAGMMVMAASLVVFLY